MIGIFATNLLTFSSLFLPISHSLTTTTTTLKAEEIAVIKDRLFNDYYMKTLPRFRSLTNEEVCYDIPILTYGNIDGCSY